MTSSLVLLPTYNERENLSEVVPRLSALEDTPDVLVIDDASPDGTGDLAERLRARYPRLSVLHRREKDGLGQAYVHGFREALRRGYDLVVTMDADLSHAPEDVPRLLSALEEADLALGSRHVAGGTVVDWPLSRRILSRAGSLYARTLLRLPVSDVTSGFRAYRASAIRGLDLDSIKSRGFIFQVEILRRILDRPGSRAVEVPIAFRERARGRSKLTRAIVLEGVLEVARLSLRRRRSEPRRHASLHAPRPFEPRVSVVIPARPGSGCPEALSALARITYPRDKLEVIVARGTSPSRQRNEAVLRSSGEILLFLDDDSLVSPETIREHLSVFERDPTVAAVGGPAEPAGETLLERVFGLVLSEPLLVGKTSSRYAKRGRERPTDERELILCNLAIRRKSFEEAGGFNEALYPNEENELLERLRLGGSMLVYRPEAAARRVERRTLGGFLTTMWRYGSGRGLQLKVLRSRTSIGRIFLAAAALAGMLSTMGGLLGGGLGFLLPVGLYAAWMIVTGARLLFRAGVCVGLAALGVGVLVQTAYLAGILDGLFTRRVRREAGGDFALEEVTVARGIECVGDSQ